MSRRLCENARPPGSGTECEAGYDLAATQTVVVPAK